MRRVKISTTKNLYLAGEAMEGDMIVKCDKEFQYNAIHLTFTGRERTEIVVSNGEGSATFRDERVYFSTRLDFKGKGVMTAGETQFPFRFTLPKEVPCSYSGRCGWVEYTLTGIVEVSLARDPKREITIEIRQPMNEPVGQPRSQSIDKDGYPMLDVEVQEDCVCLGDSVKLRFRVTRDVKMRGVRTELQTEEHAVAKRHKSKKTWTLVRQFIEETEIARDLWMNVELKTNESMPISFDGQIVKNNTSVRVTLDVPWARDKAIVIPIDLGHYAHDLAANETRQSYADRTYTG